MPTPEPTYLTLSQVALRTGRHPELLRQWCAAGRIPCARVGGSWVLRDGDLPLVDGIARRSRRLRAEPATSADPARTRIIAAVFDDDDSAVTVADTLSKRLGLARGAVGTTTLGLNGLSALRLTVVAGRFTEPASVDARRILVGFGGHIVADLDEAAAADGELRFGRQIARRGPNAGRRGGSQPHGGARATGDRRASPRAATP